MAAGTVTVEQQKLVLNSFAMVLQNNLVTADIVQWDEMDGEMDDQNGLQVLEQVTPRYNITRTVGGVKDLTAGGDGTAFGSELFAVTGTFNANMSWGDFVKIQSVGDARQSQALLGAASSLAAAIDAYILGVSTNASNNYVGTIGNPLNTWNDAVQAYTRLKEEGVEDNDMAYVLNYYDKMTLGTQVVALPGAEPMPAGTYREGFSGVINGIKTMFTQQLPVLTTGTRVANVATVTNAASNVNYSAVAKAGSVNGLRLTQQLLIGAVSPAAGTIEAGAVFTIAGVFAFDNRKQALVNPARLQQFTVVNIATAVAGVATITIFPAMVVPATGAGSDVNINTAHATVNAAPAAGALITFLGAPATSYGPRLCIQKQAIVVNTVPLILPASDTSMRRKLSSIPLSVRMWQHSDFNTGIHSVRFDVALDANIRERRRLVRVNGA